MLATDSAEMPTSSTKRRVAAHVHLAALSFVWSAHLMGPYAFAGASGLGATPSSRISVPVEAPQAPASYSLPEVVGAGVPQRRVVQAASAASASGIPRAALAAYQRAETVINAADETCNIDWQLLGAVGHVESDHGRFGGSTLGPDGVSRPGVYGIPLDGTNDTQAIEDTDAGQYDRDKVWDRAVGPMQFVPATWSAVGVDADGDGQRNPQNINDAALAAAVYLCSGPFDLGSEAGRREALLRYNRSRSYADQVLRTRVAYLKGDYAAVPDHIGPATAMSGSYRRVDAAANGENGAPNTGRFPGADNGATDRPASAPDRDRGGQASTEDEPETRPESPAPEPSSPPEQGQDEDEGTLEKVTEPLPAPVSEPVDQVVTLTQAITLCTVNGVGRLDLVAWNRCVDDLIR
ncbi:lytic transglycosylase domain-containing protein [Nocardioides luteus]|uniref:lytic transglycosylase domain-containing protein n=1 Tax=Nocardioides luteus TaxID=1844 RepID=UPI001A34D1B2|nr:lytic murein transglycosylase [Nocardioides luteus]MBG6098672.1 membrane-bound lytic murein transglycosylase B [Nocardioides luteus]